MWWSVYTLTFVCSCKCTKKYACILSGIWECQSKYSEALLTILYFFSSMFIMIMEDVMLYDCAFPNEILEGGGGGGPKKQGEKNFKLHTYAVNCYVLHNAECHRAVWFKFTHIGGTYHSCVRVEDWLACKQYITLKHLKIFTRLHGVICHKTTVFITSAVRSLHLI